MCDMGKGKVCVSWGRGVCVTWGIVCVTWGRGGYVCGDI